MPADPYLADGRSGVDELSPDRRLALYRRAARALGSFYDRFTAPFCVRCLEVTRRHHRTDPRADVDLVDGRFPGCCHAGVADALWVPRSGEEGRFSRQLSEAMASARRELVCGSLEPGNYRVRERGSGELAAGIGCRYLGPEGCVLADLKAPLCIAYLCEPVRDAVEAVAGPEILGSGTDDFGGALRALRAAVAAGRLEAEREAALLERRMEELAARVGRWEAGVGATLYEVYDSSEKVARPSVSTR